MTQNEQQKGTVNDEKGTMSKRIKSIVAFSQKKNLCVNLYVNVHLKPLSEQK